MADSHRKEMKSWCSTFTGGYYPSEVLSMLFHWYWMLQYCRLIVYVKKEE